MTRRADHLLPDARRRLAAAPFAPAPREALLLLAHVLGVTEGSLLAHPEWEVKDDAAHRFSALLERRLQGEPVAYLVGEKEFYGRPFLVDRRVLVPRPETEHLVEASIARVRERGARVPTGLPGTRARGGGAPRILDVGTGSGCVAITLALELPEARVTATDVSIAALAVARLNRARHRAPVHLAALRMLDGMARGGADLIVANLPYLDPAATDGLATDVLRWEPASALFGGGEGLDRFRELFAAASPLTPGGAILLEIGAGQADAVSALAAQYHLRRLETLRDYAGHDRVLVLER